MSDFSSLFEDASAPGRSNGSLLSRVAMVLLFDAALQMKQEFARHGHVLLVEEGPRDSFTLRVESKGLCLLGLRPSVTFSRARNRQIAKCGDPARRTSLWLAGCTKESPLSSHSQARR